MGCVRLSGPPEVVVPVVSLKRDLFELILGIGVLALGLVVILFTFAQAFALAQQPGEFLRNQLLRSEQAQGPASSFGWSSDDFNVTFTDRSTAGDSAITRWDWEFGDGPASTGQNPPIHRYTGTGPWTVRLTVTDQNNMQGVSVSEVTLMPGGTNGGSSHADLSGGLNVNLNLGDVLLPIAVVLLTSGLFLVMSIVGGMIMKAGWNILKPKPETIRVRLKPKDLTQAFEQDTAPAAPPPPPAT